MVKGERVEIEKEAPASGEELTPFYDEDDVTLYLGDCMEVMAAMPPNSVDAVVCDPPYGLEFMGNDWDSFAPRDRKNASVWDGRRAAQEGWDDTSEPRPGFAGNARGPASPAKRQAFRRCTTCGKREFSGTACKCETPTWTLEYAEGAPSAMLAFETWTEAWAREAFRVLKPGGFIISFSGTRTYHRMASGIENAGFEMRDQIHWLYGSGFPKNHDLSKAMDRHHGVERESKTETVQVEATLLEEGGEVEQTVTKSSGIGTAFDAEAGTWARGKAMEFAVTEPVTDDAKKWEGWGTALKPGHEPCALARKPLTGTLVRNVLDHGVGALNIDATRIGMSDADRKVIENMGGFGKSDYERTPSATYEMNQEGSLMPNVDAKPHAHGRWPANLVISHHFDCEPIGTKIVKGDGHWPSSRGEGGYEGGFSGQDGLEERHDEQVVEVFRCHKDCPVLQIDGASGDVDARRGFGGAGVSRYFYCPKPNAGEKDKGLENFELKRQPDSSHHDPDAPGSTNPRNRSGKERQNFHPTVKPIDLMGWLIAMVTPPGGVVLDPFMGSGSTGCAAVRDGVRFIGIEMGEDFIELAKARIMAWRPTQLGLFG